MKNRQNIEDAATSLFEVRTNGEAIDGLPDEVAPRSLDDAYAVQARLNDMLMNSGFGAAAGYKIGCTTAVMQDYLGIDHPCAGSVFASALILQAGVFQRQDLCRPGVECEIAVDIGKDILTLTEPTLQDIAPYVSTVRASIELVDDRWTDFGKVDTPSLVADNFFNAGCVVSAPVRFDPAHLDQVQGCMTINGIEAGRGIGLDILGHPLTALSWLAEHQIQSGKPLRAGEVVTLGSMVKTVWIEAGDVVEVDVSGIGHCSLRME